ncbi:ribosomal L7Ae/L30e/S12e/Gadd45 family protein [Serpentinicella sp. ANB-PHB4]|uniref:ribosomal L7Ae/L30e/S12e/Gadd45 family protein n=1 Tax=Serpentinicella sp. ANB-PHB4 TaxID=3074076 RepID=UPI00286730C4|nr:ribosomal L7Ae/L30e/S12e/Gadd45 family protein [Serpentinicella sp. ANB-PHB4]MDR5660022.1 ribosomal L7Ae/L30e/S12e/Gadd45 family protein [Serpentinicella sp. ANB-PHB4]
MTEDLRPAKKVIGLKQAVKALNSDMVELIYLAEDADEKLTGKIKELAHEKKVEVRTVESMKKLGKACGIDVGAATAALLK